MAETSRNVKAIHATSRNARALWASVIFTQDSQGPPRSRRRRPPSYGPPLSLATSFCLIGCSMHSVNAPSSMHSLNAPQTLRAQYMPYRSTLESNSTSAKGTMRTTKEEPGTNKEAYAGGSRPRPPPQNAIHDKPRQREQSTRKSQGLCNGFTNARLRHSPRDSARLCHRETPLFSSRLCAQLFGRVRGR